MAFHPRYAQNHLFYVDYTDANGDTRVVEYRSDGTRADPSSARQLFFEKQPFSNHNGGQLAFGPDGLLYIGMGDGGSGGDPNNNGQTFDDEAGEALEDRREHARRRSRSSSPTACATRGASRSTGRTATSTSATSARTAGRRSTTCRAPSSARLANFGWAVYEGRAPYDRSRKLDPRAPYVGPIQVYSHALGCSVTGGFVYRGKAVKSLVGRYFYGDYCSGTVWSPKVVKGRATCSGASRSRSRR